MENDEYLLVDVHRMDDVVSSASVTLTTKSGHACKYCNKNDNHVHTTDTTNVSRCISKLNKEKTLLH